MKVLNEHWGTCKVKDSKDWVGQSKKSHLQNFSFSHLKGWTSASCSICAVSLPHQLQGEVVFNWAWLSYSVSPHRPLRSSTLQTHPARLCSDDRSICLLMGIWRYLAELWPNILQTDILFTSLQGEGALEPFYHPNYKAMSIPECLGVMERFTSLKFNSYQFQIQLEMCWTLAKLVPYLTSHWDSSQLVEMCTVYLGAGDLSLKIWINYN